MRAAAARPASPHGSRGLPFRYHYLVWAPNSSGFQHLFTQIKPTAHHAFPWNRIDNTVCGWSPPSDLDLRDMRLRCKRFALLDFEKRQEGSLLRLLSAPPGTQRLLGAAMSATMEKKPSVRGVGPPVADEAPASPAGLGGGEAGAAVGVGAGGGGSAGGAAGGSGGDGAWEVFERPDGWLPRPTLSRDRFERFVQLVSSRMPLSVAWEEGGGAGQGGVGDAADAPTPRQPQSAGGGDRPVGGGNGGRSGGAGSGRRASFLDCTTVVDMTAPPSASGRTSRRMFMQLVYDSSASATQVWHLELRWLMCQGQQVEEIVKHCTRRARQAGLLLLQIPTDRRPRPFTPRALIVVPESLRKRAAEALCEEIGFVNEYAREGPERRWMHELGVAFVRPNVRGFSWLANRLLPSQAARAHSEKLLARFRTVCKALEFAELALLEPPPPPAAVPPAGSATPRPATPPGGDSDGASRH